MKLTNTMIGALAALGTIGAANAAVLAAGTTFGVDFGGTVSPTNNFNEATTVGGTLATVTDLTATTVDGVSVTWAITGGRGFSNDDAVVHGGEPAVYNDSNLTDWLGAYGGGAAGSITISGLDDSLTYDLNIGNGFGTAAETDTTYTADGQSLANVSTAGATAFVDLTGLSTDGSGNLVITFDGAAAPTVSALTITAVPEPSSAALLGLGGLALILRRRK